MISAADKSLTLGALPIELLIIIASFLSHSEIPSLNINRKVRWAARASFMQHLASFTRDELLNFWESLRVGQKRYVISIMAASRQHQTNWSINLRQNFADLAKYHFEQPNLIRDELMLQVIPFLRQEDIANNLRQALYAKEDHVAERLIEALDDDHIHLQDQQHNTWLHLAALASCKRAIQRLIDRGVDLEQFNKFGNSALHYVLVKIHDESLALTILQGMSDKSCLHTNVSKRSLLHYAAYYGRAKVVKALLLRRIAIDCQDRYDDTPLHDAIRFRRLPIIKLLIGSGANLDLRNQRQKSPADMSNDVGIGEYYQKLVRAREEGLREPSGTLYHRALTFLYGNEYLSPSDDPDESMNEVTHAIWRLLKPN